MQNAYPIVYATGTTDRNSLMIRLYNSFKDYVFGVFRPNYFDSKFWNATDYVPSLLARRDLLLDVALADTTMYEITGDIRYLHEAEFLMNGLEPYIYEGFSLMYSGSIYGSTLGDPLLWLIMYRLNQVGFGNYNITYMIEKLMSFAVINNATDLAWTRGYTNPEPWEGQVTFNKMYLHPVFFAYLTKEGFGNYSNHIKRIFNYWERWRAPEGGYPYDNTGGKYIETFYSNLNHLSLVLVHKLLPSLWSSSDLSSIQQSVNYFDERAVRSEILSVNAPVYLAGQGLFTFPSQYVRAFYYIWDLWDAKYWMWSEIMFDRTKFVHNLLAARDMFIALMFNPDFQKPTLTPRVMLLSPNVYGFSTSLSNLSHQWRQGSYGISPTLSGAEYLDVLYGQNPMFSYIGWNGTHYVGIAEKANVYVKLVAHKYFRFESIETNFTTTLRWTHEVSPYSKYQLFLANGTIIDLTANATYVVPERYFIINNDRQWGNNGLYCVKTDASKFTVSITSTTLRLTFNITKFYIGLGEHQADLSKQWVRERFAEILTHFKDNINFKCRDSLFNATRMEKWVKWLDPFLLYSSNAIGNMSSFGYTGDKLKFRMTAPTGVTSTTKIYVGDKGMPIFVSGATSWSYDAQRRIVQVTVTHESSAEIILEWGVGGHEDFEDISDVLLKYESPNSVPTQSSEQANSGTYSLKVDTTDNMTGASYAIIDNRQLGDFLLNWRDEGYQKYTIFIYVPSSWNDANNKTVIFLVQVSGAFNYFCLAIDVDGNLFWSDKTRVPTELRQSDGSSFGISDNQWHSVTVWIQSYMMQFKVFIDGDTKTSNWTRGLNPMNSWQTGAPFYFPRIMFGDCLQGDENYTQQTSLIYFDDFYIDSEKMFGRVTGSFYGIENLTKYSGNPLATQTPDGDNQSIHVDLTYFVNGREGYKYWLWFVSQLSPSKSKMCLLRSNNGIIWTNEGVNNPLITESMVADKWNVTLDRIGQWDVIYNPVDQKFYSYFSAVVIGLDPKEMWFGAATSIDGLNWTLYDPILKPTEAWEYHEVDVYYKIMSPTVLLVNDIYHLVYSSGPHQDYLGYATSTDGINFTKYDHDNDGHADVIFTRPYKSKPWYNPNFPNIFIWNDELYQVTRSGAAGIPTAVTISKGKSIFPQDWLDSDDDFDPNTLVELGAEGEWDDFKLHRSAILILNGDVKCYYVGYELDLVGHLGLATGTADYYMSSSDVYAQHLDGTWHPVTTFFDGETFFIESTNGSITTASSAHGKLKFTVTAPTSATSTTNIYVGDRGKPQSVSGATSWTYDTQTKIVQVSVTHTSSAEIVLDWLLGDVNLDGDVDFDDFIIFAGNYGIDVGDPGYDPRCDLNLDGDVDFDDFVIFAGNYGESM